MDILTTESCNGCPSDSIVCRTTIFVVQQMKEAGFGLVFFILLCRDYSSHNGEIVRRGQELSSATSAMLPCRSWPEGGLPLSDAGPRMRGFCPDARV